MKNKTVKLPLPASSDASERPISVAIVAMGGQGGGVLTEWIVHLAESQGWVAQSTSVPGVAQRTGATIYYVEMMPMLDGRKPVLSLMPTPGDVDVVMASEFMEAGRSILRGIVTPDRTTLIASSHRSFSIDEKMAPGNGIADKGAVAAAIGVSAKREIIFDMDALAIENGSVISAAMFGALAGSGVLAFATARYHDVIQAGGKGAEASIRTFDAAYRRTKDALERQPEPEPIGVAEAGGSADVIIPSSTADARLTPLLTRLRHELPQAAQPLAFAGLQKVIDYQDVAYGDEYLGILADLYGEDQISGGSEKNYLFTATAAKYVANAMTYDDVIRVADLKTRASRRSRIEREMSLKAGQVLHTTEFMHPRMVELLGILPAGIGRWFGKHPRLTQWLDRRVSKGRRVRTYSLHWFLLLYLAGGLRRLRRRSLRHAIEMAHRDDWLKTATDAMFTNYQLGVEILQCGRLIKGYSDTHARGLSKYEKVMSAIKLIEKREDAADWARRLREAAIKDGPGQELEGAIRTIATFA
jgi:indolepyruvate ferredoxin oxidoreductase beta subunit